jgi:hypothetical protein
MGKVTTVADGCNVTADEDEALVRALAKAKLRYGAGGRRSGCGSCKVELKLGTSATSGRSPRAC